MLVLQLLPSQFSNSVVRTDCRKSFFGVFPRYIELPMLERRVLDVIGNVIRNPTNLISTNVLGLRLFPSQFSNSVDQNDCRKSFYDVFLRYFELSM